MLAPTSRIARTYPIPWKWRAASGACEAGRPAKRSGAEGGRRHEYILRRTSHVFSVRAGGDSCEDESVTVVQRESAYQQALDWMRARIASGDWPIGARIPTEPELTELLGVGRNTLREAIKCLTSTGILEIRRGDGTYVCARTDIGGLLTRQVAVSEMLHVYEVRRALELEAVRLACVRRTDDDVRRLREALDLRNETGRTGTAAHSPTPISPSTSRSSPQPTIRSSTNCSPDLGATARHVRLHRRRPRARTRGGTSPERRGRDRAGRRVARDARHMRSSRPVRRRGARTPGRCRAFGALGVEISRSAFRSRKVFSAWQSIVSVTWFPTFTRPPSCTPTRSSSVR